LHKLGLGIIGILIITLLPSITVAGELSNASSFVIGNQDMEPYLKLNDTVISSNSTSFDNLKIGDIIVFRAPEGKTEDGKPNVIVHRISEIGTFFGKEVVRTQGDANNYSVSGIDFPIFEDNYIGKVVSVTHDTNTTTIAESEPLKTYEDQTVTETRTFEDCVTDNMGAMTLFLIFAPSKDIDAGDILNPQYKNTIINMCNFYHEKTGVWINLFDKTQLDYSSQYGEDFYQKYGNEIPEDLKQLMRDEGRIK
jgi:signal peptidase I